MEILSTRVLATAVGLALPVMSHAVVINVTTTVDVVDGADGLTSFREAFQMASADSAADEIVLTAHVVYDSSDCVEGDLDRTASDPLVITGNDATVAQGCAGENVSDRCHDHR